MSLKRGFVLLLLIPGLGLADTFITLDGMDSSYTGDPDDGTVVSNYYQLDGVLFSDVCTHSATAGGALIFSGPDWAVGCGAAAGEICGTIAYDHAEDPSIPTVTDLVSWDTLGVRDDGGTVSDSSLTAYVGPAGIGGDFGTLGMMVRRIGGSRIPEPSLIWLVALALVGMALRRRAGSKPLRVGNSDKHLD